MTAPGLPDAPDASDAAEPSRDAWLREALRHAPDAQIEAPPALSAAILREARAAVAARRPIAAASANRWSAAWAWLARPSVATGFASLMVAGFVGLLWRNGPIDPLPAEPAPALRRADSSPAAVGPASAPAVPTAPLAPQGGAARLDAPPDRPVLAPAQRPPAPPVARAQKSEVASRAPPRAAAAKEVTRPALPPSPAPAAPAALAARDTAARA